MQAEDQGPGEQKRAAAGGKADVQAVVSPRDEVLELACEVVDLRRGRQVAQIAEVSAQLGGGQAEPLLPAADILLAELLKLLQMLPLQAFATLAAALQHLQALAVVQAPKLGFGLGVARVLRQQGQQAFLDSLVIPLKGVAAHLTPQPVLSVAPGHYGWEWESSSASNCQ